LTVDHYEYLIIRCSTTDTAYRDASSGSITESESGRTVFRDEHAGRSYGDGRENVRSSGGKESFSGKYRDRAGNVPALGFGTRGSDEYRVEDIRGVTHIRKYCLRNGKHEYDSYKKVLHLLLPMEENVARSSQSSW